VWRVGVTIVTMECHNALSFVVELHFTANNIKILSVAQQWRIYVANNNETYLG
jgi:hypothetical protein